MLLPCRLRTRVSTACSATSMRPSEQEYLTPGWIRFTLTTLGQNYIDAHTGLVRAGVTTRGALPKPFSFLHPPFPGFAGAPDLRYRKGPFHSIEIKRFR